MPAEENQNQINVSGTEPVSEVKVRTELKPDDWLCAACSKKITEDKERFTYEGETEFRFTNPEGYVFDIITFGNAEGCRVAGSPVLEFTWFKDHAWSYAFCSRCGLHLGWKYIGKFSFYGLIKTRLVKGSVLFN
ncbi:MAG: cereblon family protein [Ignavibacteriaceae bacterium]